jgi:hypothetical protein
MKRRLALARSPNGAVIRSWVTQSDPTAARNTHGTTVRCLQPALDGQKNPALQVQLPAFQQEREPVPRLKL